MHRRHAVTEEHDSTTKMPVICRVICHQLVSTAVGPYLSLSICDQSWNVLSSPIPGRNRHENLHDMFRGHSRSPEMVPLDKHTAHINIPYHVVATFPKYSAILVTNRKFSCRSFIWRPCWGCHSALAALHPLRYNTDRRTNRHTYRQTTSHSTYRVCCKRLRVDRVVKNSEMHKKQNI